MNTTRPALALAIIAGTVGLIAAFLLVQNRRGEWPFARHHDGPAQAVSAPTSGTEMVDAGRAAARAPIEVQDATLDAMGIQVESVGVHRLDVPVRAVATVVADESRVSHVHARVAGWVEKLYVNTTGQRVKAGQPLAALFSQELYASQQEYVSALRRAGTAPTSVVPQAARTRLELLGMTRAEIERLERTLEVTRLVTVAAPRSGTVLSRGVTEGTSVDPSTELVTLADLSSVWVIAEVPEAEAARIRPGTTAMLTFAGGVRDSVSGKVEFVYPTLTERTRTVRVRIPVPNADGALRPGMFARAEFSLGGRDALTVPRDAVVDTGEAQHVFVQTQQDGIEPRPVKLGVRLADRIEVVEGLAPGDRVLTTGVFLIDSESRLRASGTTGHSGHGGDRNTAGERKDTSAAGGRKPPEHAHGP